MVSFLVNIRVQANYITLYYAILFFNHQQKISFSLKKYWNFVDVKQQSNFDTLIYWWFLLVLLCLAFPINMHTFSNAYVIPQFANNDCHSKFIAKIMMSSFSPSIHMYFDGKTGHILVYFMSFTLYTSMFITMQNTVFSLRLVFCYISIDHYAYSLFFNVSLYNITSHLMFYRKSLSNY